MKNVVFSVNYFVNKGLSNFKFVQANKFLALTFIITLFTSCEPPTTKEQITSDKNQLESGDANSPVAFNDGLVAEYTVIQAKALKITDYLEKGGEIGDTECAELADELLMECNRVINVLNDISAVGKGGIEFKNHAIEYAEAVKSFAKTFSSSDDGEIFIKLGRIGEIEEEFIELQKVYAKKNGFIIGGAVDPRELE